jgi:PKD repeat protein
MQVIKSIRLDTDKLTPVGEAGVLVPDAKWPVFFTRGIRVLGLAPIADFTTDFKYGNYPVTSRFLDISANEPVSWHWMFEGGNPSESFEQNPVVVFDIPGFYRVTLITSNEFGSDTLVRDRYIHAINPTPVTSITEKLPRLYPNPVTDILQITIEGNFEIKIFNLQGDLLYFSRNTPVIGVSDLSSGIYVAEITTSYASYRVKFVKL